MSTHRTGSIVNALIVASDGQSVSMACDDGSVRRWTIQRGEGLKKSFGDWVLTLFGKGN